MFAYKVGGWVNERPKICLRNIWMVPIEANGQYSFRHMGRRTFIIRKQAEKERLCKKINLNFDVTLCNVNWRLILISILQVVIMQVLNLHVDQRVCFIIIILINFLHTSYLKFKTYDVNYAWKEISFQKHIFSCVGLHCKILGVWFFWTWYYRFLIKEGK